MKIEIVRPVNLTGGWKSVGEQLDLPDAQARELMAMGKAVALVEMRGPPEEGGQGADSAEQAAPAAERKAGKRA